MTAQHALLMVKNVDSFPQDDDKMTGVIDIWWIISILLTRDSDWSMNGPMSWSLSINLLSHVRVM
jgi:hypothetical protein